jgi:hypothetical protein
MGTNFIIKCLAAIFLIAMSCVAALAQEAGTSPTCTGCTAQPRASSPNVPRGPKARKAEQGGSIARSSAIFDGAWSGTSTGSCIMTWNWKIEVSNGVISGNNVSGHISSSGSISGSMTVFGSKYDFSGHVNTAQGGGTWITTGNCSGRWTIAKS